MHSDVLALNISLPSYLVMGAVLNARVDFNFNISGVYDALPKLAKVWATLAPNVSSSSGYDPGDRLHATFPAGGCVMHTLPSGWGRAPECGHDFPDGTRIAAYEFIERHLRVQADGAACE